MRKTLVVVLFVMLNLVQHRVMAQDIMTIGQVFDYSVGDVFEYVPPGTSNPPSASRITITAKYFSNDSVYYGRFHQSYTSQVVWNPQPHLEYNFSSSYDTISFTDLDSLILFFDNLFQEDTTIYFSDQYCGVLINGHVGEIGGPFEPYLHDILYGRGLGVVKLYETDNGYEYGFTMTYYKKGNIECGTTDPIVTSIIDLQKPTITIFPNPSTNQITITGYTPAYLKLCNTLGQTVAEATNTNTLWLGNVAQGLYLLQVFDAKGGLVETEKVVKE